MAEEKRLSVQIKGVRDGLLINLMEGEWLDLEGELIVQVEEKADFFQGAKITLDIGDRVLSAAEMGALRDKLSDRGVSLWAIVSSSPKTEQTARMLGLGTRLSKGSPEQVSPRIDTELPGESAVLVHRTLRSGYKISYHGHITVIGDVNPGAEIIAGGNIVVWGKLRGVVHAGADGDETAIVCALDLMPMQLRISDKIAVTPQRKGKTVPEVARIHNGQVTAEPWT